MRATSHRSNDLRVSGRLSRNESGSPKPSRVHNFPLPLSRRSANNRFESSAESRLIGKSGLQSYLQQRQTPRGKKFFCLRDSLKNKIAVRRRRECPPKRAGKMTYRQSTFSCERRQPQLAFQVLSKQIL